MGEPVKKKLFCTKKKTISSWLMKVSGRLGKSHLTRQIPPHINGSLPSLKNWGLLYPEPLHQINQPRTQNLGWPES